jgi:hypothetical protein
MGHLAIPMLHRSILLRRTKMRGEFAGAPITLCNRAKYTKRRAARSPVTLCGRPAKRQIAAAVEIHRNLTNFEDFEAVGGWPPLVFILRIT